MLFHIIRNIFIALCTCMNLFPMTACSEIMKAWRHAMILHIHDEKLKITLCDVAVASIFRRENQCNFNTNINNVCHTSCPLTRKWLVYTLHFRSTVDLYRGWPLLLTAHSRLTRPSECAADKFTDPLTSARSRTCPDHNTARVRAAVIHVDYSGGSSLQFSFIKCQ